MTMAPDNPGHPAAVDDNATTAERERRVALIGHRIRTLRRGRLTLTQLSEISGISVGLLSRLENGAGNPALGTLSAIAAALDVNVHSLLEEPPDRMTVMRRGERAIVRLPRSRTELEVLSPNLTTGLVVSIMHLPARAPGDRWTQRSRGQQFECVLSGEVEIHVEHEVYELRRFDSILFDASRPHTHRNPSKTIPAELIVASAELPLDAP